MTMGRMRRGGEHIISIEVDGEVRYMASYGSWLATSTRPTNPCACIAGSLSPNARRIDSTSDVIYWR